ncbi:hypothetical protein EWM64_g7043 [Hericium alpestre]|uniref:Uncharacterized protein n=1 Tax=Hericium alpestre TaxID=135208 RepID=A0A4Y9ZRW1_9AGAM|nr:hypothetical protein EWM64_g7043 [Hericium alpestre]
MTKFEYIKMDSISRVDFVKAFLRVHDLDNQYSPSVHAGPDFKLWWTGSNGGKASALTIENDRDFVLALSTLMQKNRCTCAVSVEFDTDGMDGYRIRKLQVPVLADDSGFAELAYGTRVLNVDHFSNDAQLHGPIILELKQKWVCQQHLGEHGEPGHCYITPNGDHIGLNARRLKFWAAAIAAHDVTKHDPPNSLEFDGARDGRMITTKPHGRSGSQPALAPATTSQLLMAAILSNLTHDGKRR